MSGDYDKKSAMGFWRRQGILPTWTGPLPAIAPRQLLIHRQPLSPPHPSPEASYHLEGDPPPDRAQTQSWPHP